MLYKIDKNTNKKYFVVMNTWLLSEDDFETEAALAFESALLLEINGGRKAAPPVGAVLAKDFAGELYDIDYGYGKFADCLLEAIEYKRSMYTHSFSRAMRYAVENASSEYSRSICSEFCSFEEQGGEWSANFDISAYKLRYFPPSRCVYDFLKNFATVQDSYNEGLYDRISYLLEIASMQILRYSGGDARSLGDLASAYKNIYADWACAMISDKATWVALSSIQGLYDGRTLAEIAHGKLQEISVAKSEEKTKARALELLKAEKKADYWVIENYKALL